MLTKKYAKIESMLNISVVSFYNNVGIILESSEDMSTLNTESF